MAGVIISSKRHEAQAKQFDITYRFFDSRKAMREGVATIGVSAYPAHEVGDAVQVAYDPQYSYVFRLYGDPNLFS